MLNVSELGNFSTNQAASDGGGQLLMDIMLIIMGVTVIVGFLSNLLGMAVGVLFQDVNREPFAWYLIGILLTDNLALLGMFYAGVLTNFINGMYGALFRYCRFVPYLVHVGMSASGFILLVSTLERFILLWLPTRMRPSSIARVQTAVLLCVLASAVTSLPNAWKFDSYKTASGYYCYPAMAEQPYLMRKLMLIPELGTSWLLVLVLFVPLNLGIVVKMQQQSDRRRRSTAKQRQDNSKEIGVALIAACVCQIVLPFSRIVNAAGQIMFHVKYDITWHTFTYVALPCLNHVVNFYIFAATWTRYRACVARALCCGERRPPANDP